MSTVTIKKQQETNTPNYVGKATKHTLINYIDNNYDEKHLPKVIAAAIIGEDSQVYLLSPPARHHNIISSMIHDFNHATPIRGKQGFYLSDGSFADRELSLKLAKHHNQLLLDTSVSSKHLFSEDVW